MTGFWNMTPLSLHKVLIRQHLCLDGKLLAAFFMRVRESNVLDAKGGLFPVGGWFQQKSDDDPWQVYWGDALHHRHEGTRDLNFQIFTGMTSEIFDVRQFILFCFIMPFPNITPITTLPSCHWYTNVISHMYTT